MSNTLERCLTSPKVIDRKRQIIYSNTFKRINYLIQYQTNRSIVLSNQQLVLDRDIDTCFHFNWFVRILDVYFSAGIVRSSTKCPCSCRCRGDFTSLPKPKSVHNMDFQNVPQKCMNHKYIGLQSISTSRDRWTHCAVLPFFLKKKQCELLQINALCQP